MVSYVRQIGEPDFPDTTRLEDQKYVRVRYSDCRKHGVVAAAVLGEIASLCEQKAGYCYAKNEQFAKRFGLNERTVTRAIATLIDADVVFVRYLKHIGGTERRLYTKEREYLRDAGLRHDKYRMTLVEKRSQAKLNGQK